MKFLKIKRKNNSKKLKIKVKDKLKESFKYIFL